MADPDTGSEGIYELCSLCEGDGQVIEGASIHSPLLRPEIIDCPQCGGTGSQPTEPKS